MPLTKEQIGKILKQMRLNAGFTQKEVAAKIGRNQPIVGHWENGYAQPDVNTLFLLCEIYGVEDVSGAFGFEPKRPAGSDSPTEEELKFALFNGDGDITNEMYEEVKAFAEFVKQRERGKKDEKSS